MGSLRDTLVGHWRLESFTEQRDDGTKTNSPVVGNETKEGSITNYEINRTMAQFVGSPGSTRRLTVSVAVDGIY